MANSLATKYFKFLIAYLVIGCLLYHTDFDKIKSSASQRCFVDFRKFFFFNYTFICKESVKFRSDLADYSAVHTNKNIQEVIKRRVLIISADFSVCTMFFYESQLGLMINDYYTSLSSHCCVIPDNVLTYDHWFNLKTLFQFLCSSQLFGYVT